MKRNQSKTTIDDCMGCKAANTEVTEVNNWADNPLFLCAYCCESGVAEYFDELDSRPIEAHINRMMNVLEKRIKGVKDV
jgi:hypothetical protein